MSDMIWRLRLERSRCQLILDSGEEIGDSDDLLLLPRAAHSERDRVRLGLALSDDGHVRNLHHLAFAYPVVECVRAIIEMHAHTACLETLHYRQRKSLDLIGNRDDSHLLRRQP